MNSRSSFSLILSAFVSISSFAQIYNSSSYLSDYNGSILKPNKSFEGVQGSPYLSEDWCKGQVINTQDKQFEVAKIRYNILQNRIEYELNGSIFEPTIACKEFVLYENPGDGSQVIRRFRTHFPATETQRENMFYEVLYDGKAKLLRYYTIRINEYAEPMTTTKIKRFTKVSSLFIYHPTKHTVVKISKAKEDLLAVFDDKKENIEQFMSDNKIRKNANEEAIIKVCQFYDGGKVSSKK